MLRRTVSGLRLYYEPEEQAAAESIAAACERSLQLLREQWGLLRPEDVRVYVMTSWRSFVFQSAPWPWKAYLALTLPLVARRARRIWPDSGGWFVAYGRRRVVGVKPHRLIQSADRTFGAQFFHQDRTVDEIVQSVTCHELVHALTVHLHLPLWLHEGLATLAMEIFLGRRMVRRETLDALSLLSDANRRPEKLQTGDPQVLLAQFARAYWVTRYVEESRPGLLQKILARLPGPVAPDVLVAAAYDKDPQSFWREVAGEIQAWYQEPGEEKRDQ